MENNMYGSLGVSLSMGLKQEMASILTVLKILNSGSQKCDTYHTVCYYTTKAYTPAKSTNQQKITKDTNFQSSTSL